MSDVKEIGQGKIDNPEGYVGNLTDEQDKKLQQAWEKFFGLFDKAKGGGKKSGGGGGGEEVVDDPKKAGQPKDDGAKEEARKQEEEKAMNELTEQYGAEALRDAFWNFVKIDDPDVDMLRFLRARKWDVDRAVAMLAGCMKWRLDNGIEELVEKGDLGNSKEIEKWLDQYRSGKVFAYGQSIQGAPVAIINVKHHFTKGQPPETMHKFVAFSMETYRLMLVPPSDKVVLFFNLDGFGLKNMDWSAILYILKCLEAYFPESLHTLVIYKAPWIFSGIWKILGPMLDPVVRSKVVFMSKPSECEHLLPADRLIEQLGGDVEFNWEKRWVEPEDSENTIQEEKEETEKRKGAYMDLAKEYEDVTRKWFGGDSSEKLLTQRKTLVKKLRLARLEADPYLRGKTQLHREGTLDGQGKVTWLYETKNGETVRHIIGRRDCAAVLQRELKELEEGKSIKDVEKTTSDALENDDWNKLYGSEEVARQVEGSRVDGETPSVPEDNSKAIMVLGLPAGESSGQASGDSPSDDHEKGDEKGEKKAKSSGKQQNKEEGAAAAGGAAAGGGAAAAAASSGGGGKDDKQDFVDAPEASKKTVDKAENRDHVAAPKDEAAAEKSTPEYPDQSNGSAANGNAKNGNGGDSSDSSADNGDKSSLKGSVKDKTSAGKDKISSLGSKFKGMLKKN